MVDMRNMYKIFDGKPAVTRPIGRLRLSWEDNIKMYVGKIFWKNVN
jgi:hypothetical protein